MKLNDYKCVCGHIIRDWDKDTIPKCPKCGKYMWKTYPKPGVVYKGDGFTGAQTDER